MADEQLRDTPGPGEIQNGSYRIFAFQNFDSRTGSPGDR
jgi:hypothetical protein